MRISTFVISSCLLIISCQSTKNYRTTEIKRIATLYHANIKPDPNKPVTSRKELKKNLEKLERYVALSPDSLVITQDSGQSAEKAAVDSFYKKIPKINYIKEHKLESPHKILLEKHK